MITRIFKTSNIFKSIQLSDQKYKNIFKYDKSTCIVPTNYNIDLFNGCISQNNYIKNKLSISQPTILFNNNIINSRIFNYSHRSFTTGGGSTSPTSPITPISPQRNSNNQNTQDVKSTNNVRPEFVFAIIFVSVLFYIANQASNGTDKEIKLIHKSLARIEESIKRNNIPFLGGDKYTRQLEKTLQFIGIIALILSVIRLLVFKKL